MKIETKFQVGQEVWWVFVNRICRGIVKRAVNPPLRYIIKYNLDDYLNEMWVVEEKLFATKEELLASL